MYDISSNSWTSKNNLPNTLGYAESVTYNNYIYLVGGTSDNFSKYDTSNDSWTSLGSTYCRSQNCRTVMIGSTLYVMGRLSSSTSGVSNYTALKAYSFSGSSWSTKASMSTGRAHFGAAVYDSKIYVFGGQSGSGSYDLTDSVEVYDPSTNSWSNHTTIPQDKINNSCSGYDNYYLGGSGYPILATTIGTKILISSLLSVGLMSSGSTCASNGLLLIYDVSGNSWSSGDEFSSSRKMYTSDSVAASSTKVYYSGSNSGSSNSNKALFSYIP
jgi:N-acetylneuraminic acid mutarotase